MLQSRFNLSNRRTKCTIKHAILRWTARLLPLKALQASISILRNFVYRIEEVCRICTICNTAKLAVLKVCGHIATLDICHHCNLRAILLLHIVDSLHITVHIVAVQFVLIVKVRDNLLTCNLIIVCSIYLSYNHRVTLKLSATELALLIKYMHTIREYLILITPQHRVLIEVDNRVGTANNKRVADHLRITAIHTHTTKCHYQLIARIYRYSVALHCCCISLDLAREVLLNQRVEHMAHQRILRHRVCIDYRVNLAEYRVVDRLYKDTATLKT